MHSTLATPKVFMYPNAIAILRWAPQLFGLAALLLGVHGFLPTNMACWDGQAFYKAVLTTSQLFVLNVGADEIPAGEAQVASFLAPLATAGAAALLLHQRFLRRVRQLILKLRPADDLVLGGGALAAAIFSQAPGPQNRGRRLVVGLDTLPDSPLKRVLVDHAVAHQHGYMVCDDAQSASVLQSWRAHRARHVWVLTGDDLLNLDIARQLVSLRTAQDPAQHIIVSIRDAKLARAHRDLLPKRPEGTQLHVLDVARMAARQLLLTHPPAYPRLGSGQGLHLCVLGHSALSVALIQQAATHCVYAESPEQAVRITLISSQASQAVQALYERHPALDPRHARDIGALLPLARIDPVDVDPAVLMPGTWQSLQDKGAFDMVYVAAEHDLLTFAAARRVLAVRDATGLPGKGAACIVACLNDRGASPAGNDAPWPAPITTFDVFQACFSRDESYPGERSDRRAKVIHGFHAGVFNATNTDPAGSLQARLDQAWRLAGDDFRWSSRMAADHINVKLATLGWLVRPMGSQDAQSGAPVSEMPAGVLDDPATLEPLMRLEHRRFVAERLVDGWLPLPTSHVGPQLAPSGLSYQGKAESQKALLWLNTTLVPFEQLSPEDQGKDKDLILAVPGCLRVGGEGVLRKDACTSS